MNPWRGALAAGQSACGMELSPPWAHHCGVKKWGRILWRAAKNWSEDHAFQHSAAVGFYTLFSLAPITIIALAVAGFFFGPEAARGQLNAQITQLVGKQAAQAIQAAVASSEPQRAGWESTVIGVAVLLIGATTVFSQLQDSLNEIWRVMPKPSRSGFKVLLTQRLISFAMVVTVGFLLLVSLILTTALTAMVHLVAVSWSPDLLRAADFIGTLGVITVLFALVFKVMPDVVLSWDHVWRGALVTAVLFSIGRFLIALYLGHSSIASVYGAAGSLVALLVWVYYSAAILFFGVEFTRAYCTSGGREVQPKRTAVRIRRVIVE